MKRLVLSLAVAGLLSQVAVAQELTDEPVISAPVQGEQGPVPVIEQTAPAETWRREPRPEAAEPSAVAVHKNAAIRGQQRRERMNFRKAVGHSMSRPVASPSPHAGGSYGPVLLIDLGAVDLGAPAPSMASQLRPLIR